MSPYNSQHIPKHINLYLQASQQTLSKAFSKSTETPLTSNDGCVKKTLLILCIIESNGCTQGSRGLKPDWLLLSRLLVSTYLKKRIEKIFHKRFSTDWQ